MKTWMKIIAGLLLLVALVLGVAAGVLPGVVERRTQQWLRETTGRQLRVAAFSINPLTLTATAKDVRLSAPHRSETVASIAKVRVSFSFFSLFYRALILTDARFDQPKLTLIRLAPGVFNLSDLAALRKSSASGRKSSRYLVDNLVITDGSVDFTDRTVTGAPRHRLREVNLAVPFFGNVSYLADRYVTPSLSAVIDGSSFTLKGRLKPTPEAIEASLAVNLHDVDLSRYAAYVPHLPIRIKTGRMTTALKVVYRTSQTRPPVLQVGGEVTLTGVSIFDRLGHPVFLLPYAWTNIRPSQLLERRLHLSRLIIYNPEVFVSRDRQGVWNHTRLMPPKGSSGSSTSSTPSRPFLVTVAVTRLRGGKIHFADARPPGGFRAEAKDIALDLKAYSTAGKKPVPFHLTLRTERAERGDVHGTFTIRPLAVDCTTEIQDLALNAYYPYLAAVLTSPVSGRADARARVQVSKAIGLKITQAEAEVRDPAVSFGPGDGLRLARIALSGGALDLKDKSLAVSSIDLEKGDLRFSRTPAGKWTPLALLAHRQSTAPSRETVAAPRPPWRTRIDAVRGNGWRVTFHDEVPKKRPTFTLSDLDFSVTHLNGPEPTSSPFQLKGRYGKKGRLALSGTAVLANRQVAMKTRLRDIHLPDFAPYLPPTIRIVLVDGDLDADLALTGERKQGLTTGTFQGRVGIRNFYSLDADHREDLLKWGSLQIADIRGDLTPFTLHIGSVALSDYYAKVLVDPKARLNLLQVFAAAKEKTPAQKAPTTAAKTRDIRIDAVTLQGGTVDFSDQHLIRPFSTRMLELGGSVSGLSSDPRMRADVDLRGSLENQSPLSITGKINPLSANLYAKLKLTFSNIELIPFSPFTGTYLGYLIDKGKLSLTLEYLIDHRRLDAQNKVFLDQFTLGQRVESKKATSLPVRLAVALLKDRNGEIHLDLPVSGRTDDPHFRIWSLVFQVVKNLFVKAITSPFSLLASLFGGGHEDLSTVDFAYGSSRLPPPEQQKLLHLAKALGDRPGLTLEIAGFVDPEHGPEGYRKEQLRERMQRAKYLSLRQNGDLPPGASAGDITVGTGEFSRYLDEVYRQADFPKPRNFFGMLKSLPDKEKEKLLLTHIPAGPPQMEALAQARATVVQAFLKGHGVSQDRMFVVRSAIDTPPAKKGTSRSRVQFKLKAR